MRLLSSTIADATTAVRANLVRERLDAIEAGSAAEILTETDQRERERKTWCVGVRWDYTREDLVEIVEALGGRAVAAICRVFAEEWGHRVGGMPDLWCAASLLLIARPAT